MINPTKKYHYTFPITTHDRICSLADGDFVAGLRILDYMHFKIKNGVPILDSEPTEKLKKEFKKELAKGYVTVKEKKAQYEKDHRPERIQWIKDEYLPKYFLEDVPLSDDEIYKLYNSTDKWGRKDLDDVVNEWQSKGYAEEKRRREACMPDNRKTLTSDTDLSFIWED